MPATPVDSLSLLGTLIKDPLFAGLIRTYSAGIEAKQKKSQEAINLAEQQSKELKAQAAEAQERVERAAATPPPEPSFTRKEAWGLSAASLASAMGGVLTGRPEPTPAEEEIKRRRGELMQSRMEGLRLYEQNAARLAAQASQAGNFEVALKYQDAANKAAAEQQQLSDLLEVYLRERGETERAHSLENLRKTLAAPPTTGFLPPEEYNQRYAAISEQAKDLWNRNKKPEAAAVLKNGAVSLALVGQTWDQWLAVKRAMLGIDGQALFPVDKKTGGFKSPQDQYLVMSWFAIFFPEEAAQALDYLKKKETGGAALAPEKETGGATSAPEKETPAGRRAAARAEVLRREAQNLQKQLRPPEGAPRSEAIRQRAEKRLEAIRAELKNLGYSLGFSAEEPIELPEITVSAKARK